MSARSFALALIGCLVVSVAEARADCCNIVKRDAEAPTVELRVCEAETSQLCDIVIFEGAIGTGDSVNFCTAAETVVYQESPAGEATYGAPVTAVCDGGDVEI